MTDDTYSKDVIDAKFKAYAAENRRALIEALAPIRTQMAVHNVLLVLVAGALVKLVFFP